MRKSILQVILCFSVLCSPVFAKNMTIAFVNTQQIVAKWQNEIDKNLQVEFKIRKEDILKLQQDIQSKINKLNKDNAIMSNTMVNSTKTSLDEMNKRYQEKAQRFQTEYNEKGAKILQARLIKLEQAVNKVAKNKKIDIVLQKNTALFIGDARDITPEVKKQISTF